ncbi:hypothetical protein Q3G72_017680 [Acer saccharum]|nr:hypothetical protein Q3G72_017680 [Acer saccharum]
MKSVISGWRMENCILLVMLLEMDKGSDGNWETQVIIGEAAKESLSNLRRGIPFEAGKRSWGCVCVPTEQCSYDSFQDLITCDLCFTKFNRTDYIMFKSENRIMLDGVNAKLLGCHGPLSNSL